MSGVGARPAGPRAARARLRRDWLERLSLLALDVAAFAAGLRLAHALFLATPEALRAPQESSTFAPAPRFEAFTALLVVQVAVLLVVFFLHQLYHQPRGVSRLDLVGRLLRAVSIGVILTHAVASFALPELTYSRLVPVYNWLTTFLGVTLLRSLHRTAWEVLRRAGYGRDRVLVVGAGAEGRDLVARMQRRPHLGYEVVGFADDAPGRARARGVPILGRTAEVGRLVDALGVDEVLIALPEASREAILELVSRTRRDGVTIRVFPDVFQIMATEVRVSELDGLPLLTMHEVALRGWRRILKRGVDVVISSVCLILISPLMVLVALLVKLESRGPVFYVQDRVGLDGRPFAILKFRSMRTDAEAATGAVWACRDDPRRTRLGDLLRRTSIDELPQLINVLLGDMSIVGPRPERPEFVATFQRSIPRYMERHREKTGITGWAQVNGLRGDTSIEERTKYDIYYVENWSLLFDFKIMAKTVLKLFRDPNAY